MSGLPVLTLHTDGDGLVTPDNERAYADVVGEAGQADLLRQLYIHRGGHCTMTFAEILTALDVLMARVESGEWPSFEAATLNAAAGGLAADCNVLASGASVAARFADFEPRPFPRSYDARHMRSA